jgi:hypothetical protein
VWPIIDSENNPQATNIPVLDEPLELNPAPVQKSSVLTGVAYALTSLLLIAVLAAQYLAYHFHTLSQNPTLRPWLGSICQTGLCALPPRSDISQIRSEELSLRSHPELDDALILQMNFRNMAGFSQPLPALDLIFTDIRGTAVAGRRFQPWDYLGLPDGGTDAGSVKVGAMTIPAGGLVMASLVFSDPGTHAVNYQVTFATTEVPNNPRRNILF